ncbi:MAG: ATP-binding protein [Waterburya sp.]
MNIINWAKIDNSKIAAIEFPLCDRDLIIDEISAHHEFDNIYFWNKGYRQLQQVTNNLIAISERTIESYEQVIEQISSLNGILILEGIGIIAPDSKLAYQLENLYFNPLFRGKLLIVDCLISIPDKLYAIIPTEKIKLPNLTQIQSFLAIDANSQGNYSQYIGLSYGEIKLLTERGLNSENILAYKTEKLAKKGLRITPEPDVDFVGGLNLLMRDLNKIKKLFTVEAFERGLRPPKGALFWGLPGTGKSLIAKMLSKILGVPLISCDWNQLVSTNLAESLQNLELLFQLIDSIGACVLFFDEFEKAFFGWDSSEGGGVMAKLAGGLLSWMQDHTSPSIMVATINRLDMLPPEMIRRFEYIWFFDIDLHNGAMHEILAIHLETHFPGFCGKFQDEDWYRLFAQYRFCSPSELAGAVRRVHDELFYNNLHNELTTEILIEQLIKERRNFKPAASDKKISDALAKIRRSADFARPVRGKDYSRFAAPPVKLFQKKVSQLPSNYTYAI